MKPEHLRSSLLTLSAALLLAMPPAAAPQAHLPASRQPRLPDRYTIDFVSTAAFGIAMNDAGDVIGTSYVDTGCGSFCLPPQETVVWRAGERIVLPPLPGATTLTPRAINQHGWIVGDSGNRATLWRPVPGGYQATDLGLLPGTTTSAAVAIDAQDRVVGWSTTTNFPPQGAPFLWTPGGGLTNLAALGFPNEAPMAISRGGAVATYSRWYRLGDLASVTTLAAPPSGYSINNGSVAINDAGDQARFLVSSSGQNLRYFYRYLHDGAWQRLSNAGTGHLSTYGTGAIDDVGTITGTVQSAGVVAYGPDELAVSLASRISPAYGAAPVVWGGTVNASGVILARVLLGAGTRLVRLVPLEHLPAPRMRVASLSVAASFVPDPSDPTQDHCSPDLDAHNVALVAARVVDEAGAPLANAIVSGRFLDGYWMDLEASGRTDAAGEVRFAFTGPCGVGAITFFVDGVELAGFSLDRGVGVLVASAIPQ